MKSGSKIADLEIELYAGGPTITVPGGIVAPEKNDIIQIIPSHKWGGCLAVVDEVYSWGVQAFVSAPISNVDKGQMVEQYYIRLNTEEFEMVDAKVIFISDDPESPQ